MLRLRDITQLQVVITLSITLDYEYLLAIVFGDELVKKVVSHHLISDVKNTENWYLIYKLLSTHSRQCKKIVAFNQNKHYFFIFYL